VIRGAYLDGWKPASRPPGERTRDAFLKRVAEELRETPGLSAETAAGAVFTFLSRRELLEGFWPLPGPEDDPHERLERTKREIEAALAAAREEEEPPRAARPPRAPRGGIFDKAVHTVLVWVKDLHLQRVVTRRGAFRVMVAVLRALRDRLIMDEAFDLGSQLPMILRGFYFEGWRPDATPIRERRKEEFLKRVESGMNSAVAMGAEIAVRAVFALLARRVSEGELEDVRQGLPEPIRELWPAMRARSRAAAVGGRVRASRGPTPRSRARRTREQVRSAMRFRRRRMSG
jgi:uncharacterized protein (DUF2267 family)